MGIGPVAYYPIVPAIRCSSLEEAFSERLVVYYEKQTCHEPQDFLPQDCVIVASARNRHGGKKACSNLCVNWEKAKLSIGLRSEG